MAVTVAALGVAQADTWGRYKIVGSYVTDVSDGVAGLYFQTVAEQGGETAAYAVIGQCARRA